MDLEGQNELHLNNVNDLIQRLANGRQLRLLIKLEEHSLVCVCQMGCMRSEASIRPNRLLLFKGKSRNELRYDIYKNKWSYVGSMKQPRCTHAAIASPDLSAIYAIGGFDEGPLSMV